MSAEKSDPINHVDSSSEELGFEGDHIDLNNNKDAKIKNPLAGISRSRLLNNVDDFAREHDLTDISDLLKRGALVAQDPANFENVEGLQDEEREALRNEVLHKWRQPRAMYFTVILCSVGAAVQGWDQTGSNGANLSFPQEFGIENNEWLIGLINAGPYIASALVGCWLSDPLNNYLGRRGVRKPKVQTRGTRYGQNRCLDEVRRKYVRELQSSCLDVFCRTTIQVALVLTMTVPGVSPVSYFLRDMLIVPGA